jgi:nucleoside-diphosphate-sugar epimerase
VLTALAAEPGMEMHTASRSAFGGGPGHVELDLGAAGTGRIGTLLAELAPNIVVNCSGATSGGAAELAATNITGPGDLVAAMVRHVPWARLIHLGSAAEYGRTEIGLPISESAPALPVGEYGLSKLAGTRLVMLGHAAGLDSLVLRVFNPIGPGAPAVSLPGRLVAELVRASAEGDEVRLGPLDSVRDFVDARDVARAVGAAISGPPQDEAVLNVGGGRGISVREIVDGLVRISGFAGRIVESSEGSSRSAAVPWQQADISAIDKRLSWQPEFELATSLHDLWQESTWR